MWMSRHSIIALHTTKNDEAALHSRYNSLISFTNLYSFIYLFDHLNKVQFIRIKLTTEYQIFPKKKKKDR